MLIAKQEILEELQKKIGRKNHPLTLSDVIFNSEKSRVMEILNHWKFSKTSELLLRDQHEITVRLIYTILNQ